MGGVTEHAQPADDVGINVPRGVVEAQTPASPNLGTGEFLALRSRSKRRLNCPLHLVRGECGKASHASGDALRSYPAVLFLSLDTNTSGQPSVHPTYIHLLHSTSSISIMSRPQYERMASTNLAGGGGYRQLEGKVAVVTGASRGTRARQHHGHSPLNIC